MKTYANKRALVIEDFNEFAQSVKGMLMNIGLEQVDLARNGEVGLEIAERTKPQVILCDFNLGNGKNGMQVLEQLHHEEKLSAQSIFIMITAENTTAMVMSAIDYQPDAYLTKPFNIGTLQSRLDKLVTKKQTLSPLLRALDKKDYASVVKQAEKLEPLHPKYKMSIKNYKATALVNERRFTEALEIYDAVLEGREVPWALIGKSKAYIKSKQIPAAVSLLESIIKQYPMILEAYDLLVQCKLKMKQVDEAQEILQDAIAKSPNSILRQNKLGNLALDNDRPDVAETAFKKAVRLGSHSVFKSADNYLKYTQSIAKQLESDHFEVTKARIVDAQTNIEQFYKAFRSDKFARVQGRLVEGELMVSQGFEEQAEKMVSEAKTILESIDEMPEAGTALLIAECMQGLGHEDTAQELLMNCIEQNFEDREFVERAMRSVKDKSIIERGRAAQKLNAQGIRLFEQRKYQEAVDSFKQAIESSPQNISVILNTVQVMLKVFEVAEQNTAVLDQCRDYLESIKNLSSNDHRYPRFNELSRLTQAKLAEYEA